MQTKICTHCGSDQTEKMLANHDDYLAYRCHSCGNLFQVSPDSYQFLSDVDTSVDTSRILFQDEYSASQDFMLAMAGV